MKHIAILLLFCSSTAYGSIINNGSYTTDTSSGLDWLDITATQNLSYNEVQMLTSAGGELSDWHFASIDQLYGFVEAFDAPTQYISNLSTFETGDDPTFYNNHEAIGNLFEHWGILSGNYADDGEYISRTNFIMVELYSARGLDIGVVQQYSLDLSNGYMYVSLSDTQGGSLDSGSAGLGAALIRTHEVSTIPLPSGIIFLGSSLLGLFGFRRHQTLL